MKQILLLLLFPCLCLAQYTGNANQKITLGEQTTADGLVYRGNAADTVAATLKITKTNKSDTSVFLLLDTINNVFLKYNIGTTFWTRLNILPTDTATMLLPYYRAGRNTIIQAADVPTLNQNTTGSAATLTTGRTVQTNLATTSAATFNGSANITPGVTGVLPVANGGTGQSTLTANKVMVGNGTSGVITPTNLHWDNGNSRLGIGNSNPEITIDIIGSSRYQNITSSFTEFSLRISDANNNFFSSRLYGNSFDRGETLFGLPESNNFFMFTSTNQAPAPDMAIGPLGGNKLILGTANLERLRISGDGKVNIGYGATDNGAYKLQILDSVYVGGNVSASAYTTRSDYNLKDEIQNISYGINEVMQMQPVKYTYKSNGSTQLGFIAQDLGVITPEVVSFEDKMSVYYNALIPILTKAIQEQNALIKALEQRILTLENK